jgi:catechol-2,3-dioxygenase
MIIKHLKLFTNELQALKGFYVHELKMKMLHDTPDSFQIQIGNSKLTFQETNQAVYYHFAINIPENQVEVAKRWVDSVAKILPYEGQEIVDFKSWNAKAVYFNDPGGNIVELIARLNLKQTAFQGFGVNSFLCISEVGTPVKSVQSCFDSLNEECGLELYSGDTERFAAIGDENGLFIAIDPTVKKWIPEDREAYYFPLEVEIENENKNYFYKLTTHGKLLPSTPF